MKPSPPGPFAKITRRGPTFHQDVFISNINVDLFSSHGKIILPENSVPNIDSNNDGIFDSFEIIVSYSYYVPNTTEIETPKINGIGTGNIFYEIVIF